MKYLIKRNRWMLLLATCLMIILLPGVASADDCETKSNFRGCSSIYENGSGWWTGAGITEELSETNQGWIEVTNRGIDRCDFQNPVEKWDTYLRLYFDYWYVNVSDAAQYDTSGCDAAGYLSSDSIHYSSGIGGGSWFTMVSIAPHPGYP